MSRFTSALLAGLLLSSAASAADKYPGVGRAALPAEIQAWDIDVRPDFKGLPPGSGSVAKGQELWDAKCASCHGTFGESNEVFTPIVGGTTAQDVKTGRVKALTEPVPRTTLMKVSSISTLWDYIHRAMPWNAPKSLANDDVYALVAYILNLGDIVPADYVLSDKNIGEAQNLLPNRNGKARFNGLWDVRGKPDTANPACMKDCKVEMGNGVASALPDFARGASGNLAEQQRLIGPTRGQDTTRPAKGEKPDRSERPDRVAEVVATPRKGAASPSPLDIAKKSNCMACHQVDKKLVGPSYEDIAAKYKGDAAAESRLVDKIKKGGSGVWGQIPMPPNAVKDEDALAVVRWILGGASAK